MITTKELNKIRGNLAIIGTGAKRDLAEHLGVKASAVSRYLKYGDIPEAKLKLIYKFLKANLK
jgi:predicted transcriptional regulator